MRYFTMGEYADIRRASCWLAVLLSSLSVFVASAVGNQRPNVVLILSDDQNWHDYGFMGSTDIETPNLDRLAKRSLVFRRGYVVSALCRPSLASIVTGLYPHQHGVCGNDVSPARGLKRAQENQPVIEKFHRHPSWIRLLVANGYRAFQAGKWWEGSWQDGGFTDGMTHGDHTRGGRHGDAGLTIGRQSLAPIKKFIEQSAADDQPFCVWYAPFLPHTPHNPSQELLAKYQRPDRPDNVAKYYAMCEWFDQTCGELLDYLDQNQLSDNTLVVYLADNGWTARDDTADLPTGWWPAYAPRSKGSPYEGGIRTPMMFCWPDKIAAGESSVLASSLDLMPTILHACNIPLPKNLPGINLFNQQNRRQRKAIFGATYATHNMQPGDPEATLLYRWCIQDSWKLLLQNNGKDTTHYRVLHEWDREPVRLYDLKRDPGEQTNLAAKVPKIVQTLRSRIVSEIPANSVER